MTTQTKTFRNTAWTHRNYECTNLVACQATVAPGPKWIETDSSILDGLTKLHSQAGATFFGYL